MYTVLEILTDINQSEYTDGLRRSSDEPRAFTYSEQQKRDDDIG